MRGTKKGASPELFDEWMAKENASWTPTYRDLRGQEKKAVVKQLFREQAGCCVYCGRKLKLVDYRKKSHIDHFRPIAKFPNLELAYCNLVLSCGPEGESGAPSQTCGHFKKDWFSVSEHIDPRDYPCSRFFEFRASGSIEPHGHSAAEKMIEVLNLNDSELVADRGATINGVEAEIMQASDPDEVLDIWRERDNDGFEKGLSHVVLEYFGDAS